MYLIENDFLPLIQPAQLSQLQTSDIVLDSIMAMAEAEVRSHLVQKYIVDVELASIGEFDLEKQYYAGDRIFVNDGIPSMYYGTYPFPAFDLYKQYIIGDKVYYGGHTWQALRASIIPYPDPQYVYYANIPAPNVFPTTGNNAYWLDLGAYEIPIGELPEDNPTWWTKGDNRNQQLKNYMVDICLYHLHARLAPTNAPNLREQRYMGKPEDRSWIKGRLYFPEYSAIGWLQAASEGRVTAALPPIQPIQGRRIRSGGEIRVNNTY